MPGLGLLAHNTGAEPASIALQLTSASVRQHLVYVLMAEGFNVHVQLL